MLALAVHVAVHVAAQGKSAWRLLRSRRCHSRCRRWHRTSLQLRGGQQEGALLPQRVCLLMEGQETGRGEPARRRHHEEGSASGAAAMWKGDRLLGVGGWAEATAEMEPRKRAEPPRPEWHSGRARPAWHKAMQLYPDGQRPAVLRDS